jgi:hypothetical protein
MKGIHHDFFTNWKSRSFVFFILVMIGVPIALALIRSPASELTLLTAIPSMQPAPIPTATEDLEQNKIVESLLRSKWQSTTRQNTDFASEVVTWEFYPNRMFRWQLTSDFSEERTGAWSVPPISEERGVVFLASTTVLTRFDVLSLKFENGRLILGEFAYERTSFTGTETPPTIIPEDLDAITNQPNRFFSSWLTVTTSDWQNESTTPPGDANLYAFMQDGTYSAHFDATQCQYNGTWSLSTTVGGNDGTVWLSVPANTCDQRGAQDAFVREIPFRLNGNNLILYETVYVPIPKSR